MQKISIDIPAQDGKWGSYISKYPADSGKVQPNMFTAGSSRIITSASGQAEKQSGGAIWNPNSLLSGAALDQYEGIFADGTRLFIVNDAGTLKASTGNGTFSSIQSGFTNPANFEFATYQNRVYGCNGVDSPCVLDRAISYGGVSYTANPAKYKVMGAQAPSSAATAVRNTDSTANQVPAGSHTYKITYTYYNGIEESNGSAASSVCVNDSTHTSNALSAIPVGGYGVTARNIYRDNNDGNWLLLATINDNTTTTYTDILAVGSTPTAIPTSNNVPGVFKYIALYLDRLFVIDVTGKNILWSIAGEPDVFQPQNALSGPQDDVMTAIYVFNGVPWVFGQHTVGTILGTDDGSFFYNPISTTVGCIDNRSIQTRSIVSVPTLLWLSAAPNKGIYYSNGSIVQYLSDFIEDLTFNLAQVSYLQRQNTQNSQTAFQGGTASPAIDLVDNPGTIETINPTQSWSHAADWAAGVLSNIAVSGDQLMVPINFVPVAAAGSFSGSAVASGSQVTLSSGPVTNEDYTGSGNSEALEVVPGTQLAQAIDPARNGSRTLQSVTVQAQAATGSTSSFTVAIYSDGSGLPGSALYTSSTQTVNNSSFQSVTVSPNLSISQSSRYWIVVTGVTNNTFIRHHDSFNFAGLGQLALATNGGSGWSYQSGFTWSFSAAYVVSGLSSNGSWTSTVYDTLSTTLTSGMQLIVSSSYPSSTSASVTVQGSSNQSSWTTTDTLSSPSGTISLTGGNYRYWRILVSLSTSDNRIVPAISAPILTFNTTGTWTSAAVLCTTDITSLVNLINNASIPAGTTVTITIATSADNVTYSSYSALNLATPAKWAKVRITMTTDTGNTVSPTLLSAELDWAVSANLISSAIDTGATPAGWSIFQWNSVGTGGTISFFFRSAATSAGLSSASWSSVTNGSYPTSTPLEFCQWKVVMTATANNIPQVNSVTVNWLLTSGANVRAASLFFNKSYYLAVALQGNNTNNVLIELDYEGNWRIHSGINISTLGLYFNDAFNCDALSGKVLNMFKLPTDNGTNITFDLRTKAFVFGEDDHYATVRSVRVKGVNTGTTIHVYYSVDKGTTWNEMLNTNGTTGYTTTNDGSYFNEYFVVNMAGTAPISGTTVMYRIVSSDQYACKILKIRPTVYVRKGKYLSEV